ncbi:hypothetical protein JOF56_009338 [Kibdelosporangium banguiense]|uniref:MmyB-like transcription regulator ligand binding domain-containing protein n=1 Tax=Kibdelosporangium banguiense TaxID=1365924 RepID=A0ABS4TX16_9PSEU|nr:hypothetical protein [Kibdelosporangium banguiense]MBP2328953.1 hypothetical protein [Kibdelosporangium banguiense]
MTLDSADADKAADAEAAGCLRFAQARYPADPELGKLIADLRSGSARFEAGWRAGQAGRLHPATQTLEHPELGRITLDRDNLHMAEGEQILVVYSAAPGTPAASQLDLLRVTGTEQFTGSRT